MNRSFSISMLVAVILQGLSPIPAFAFDARDATDQLAQSLAENIQRQRMKAQREDAEEARRAQLPDLSRFGVPVEVAAPPRAASGRRSVHCTTINLGSGDSATDCD
jgi:hypothetical protein